MTVAWRVFSWALTTTIVLVCLLPSGGYGAEKISEKDRVLPTPLRLKKSYSPDRVQYEYYDFIWKSFIALNWPNVPIKSEHGRIVEGFRGEPDARAHILDQRGRGRLRMSVWETYREPGEVFLDPKYWATYPVWNTPRPQPGNLTGARTLLQYSDGFAEYATGINQPYFFDNATGPLVDQNGNFVRYEVAINQAFFEYIKHFRYYDAGQQKVDVARFVENPNDPFGFKRPPNGNEEYLKHLKPFARQGLVDVKAAWRVLDKKKGDRPERYLHRAIVIDSEGRTRLMGLVALHVLRYILIEDGKGDLKPGYVAATFEQVDNVDASPGIKPSFNTGTAPSEIQKRLGFEGPIPPMARSTNPKPQQPVSVYRVTPIPGTVEEGKDPPKYSVAAINRRYRRLLKPSVFSYYQLIGTQNKHPGHDVEFTSEGRKRNGHEGPLTGVYTNTNNLINSALESYTQKNFSCILCHVRARPQGVPEKAFEVDHFKTLTFLLQMARTAEN